MRCFDRFIRDQQGSATIEFVLWVPVILALLVIVIDATTLYVTHKEMWNVARDAARRVVTNPEKYDEEAVRTYVDNAMNLREFPYTVNSSCDSLTDSAEVIIQLRVNDMAIAGYSPLAILGRTMTARVHMRSDPNLPCP